MNNNDFTNGSILPKLIKFMFPVLLAMFLQAMYGAVDLVVVGQFATNADVSGVSTGSQIIFTLTNLVISFAMGITVAVGERIGEKKPDEAAKIIGTGLVIFSIVGLALTVICGFGAKYIAIIMQAPDEAFSETTNYIRICGFGYVVITAYNLLGSIFRGLGDSKTPLYSVAIACVFNIFGDILFVKVFGWGASGAAFATVISQFISVIISFIIIMKSKLPFRFSKSYIKINKEYSNQIFKIGIPIAIQDFLVGVSFLILMAIVNGLGLIASSAIGVSEKVCAFIMLVPSAFMQSMSSFVAQNVGALKPERARKALFSGIAVSFAFGVVMFVLAFFFGDYLSMIYTKDVETIMEAWDYLKAYAIDCLFTCFLFCFLGYYNGISKTKFVMVLGIVGSMVIRVPVAFLMRSIGNGRLFLIGLSTPIATLIQITICFIYLSFIVKKEKSEKIF